MHRNKKGGGFSIVEVLFGISIFVVIVLALTMFSRNTWLYNSFVTGGLSNVDNIRQALKTMTAEIRTASTAETGAYVISQATTTTFTFYSDIDSDQIKEKVRYFLDSGQLKKGLIEPTGSPLTYNPANEVISTLIYNVTNASTFEFYDKNYDGTTAPLSAPVDVASVRLIKINVAIDKDPNHAPVTNTFSTQVSIRNLKDNL
ncbi:MAG: hypothetical protein AAB815_01940 [Patescibacteria group bacterium]